MRRRRLRIAVDGTAYGACSSGVGWHVYHLVRALGALESGHRITVLRTPAARSLEAGAPPGLRFVELAPSIRILRLLWRTAGLPPAQLFAGSVDVIHCPFFLPCPALRSPYTITVHDLTYLLFPEVSHPSNRRVFTRWLPGAARRAAAVIVDSAAVGEQVVERLLIPRERVRVVLNAVDPIFGPGDPTLPPALTARGVRAPYLLFVGTIEPRKDVPTLIDAFARLRACRRFPHRLVLAGAPGHGIAQAREAARRHGVEREIDWLGYVDRRHLPALYRAADAFVFPSIYEGFGFPPLEALACGTPVVGSSAPSLSEILGQGAAVVPPRDPAALAGAVERVLSDRDYRKALLERGAAAALERRWETVARSTLAILEEAAERGGP
jgi:glycosyltransferase involved in cell wall biosynthesis